MTIKEIAKLANTSTATVSRVLNDKNYKCKNKELEEKIWELAAKLNYAPNTSARDLRINTHKKESVFTIDIYLSRFEHINQDSFFQELFYHLKKELMDNGCALGKILNLSDVIKMEQNSGKTLSVPYKKAKEQQVTVITEKKDTGLIILGKCPQNLIGVLKSRYKYIAGIDRNPTDYEFDEVVCNGATAAEVAMEHLLSLGHRNIAYIGDCTYESRYIGYYQTLLKHKIALNHSNIYPTDQTMEQGSQAMENILNSNNRPTAIFCANDTTAIGVINTLNKNKRKKYFPSIISIDNILESEKTSPMLTTINIPKKEMAHFALNLLLDSRRGCHKENIRIEFPCRLVERESCFLA